MKNYFILFALSVWMTGLSTNAHGREIPDFFWMKKVGAMSYPVQQAVYNVTDYGAKGDALSMNTMAIQKAIDAAEQAGGGIVVVSSRHLSYRFFICREQCKSSYFKRSYSYRLSRYR